MRNLAPSRVEQSSPPGCHSSPQQLLAVCALSWMDGLLAVSTVLTKVISCSLRSPCHHLRRET